MTDLPASLNSTNPKVASVARAYDYVLGGKDNFEVDRQFAEEILRRDPEVRVSASLNKEFGRRVTDYMASQGVQQFLDLGSGIPTSPPSIHETARNVVPSARVVYVDHDPVVVAHNRALRAIGSGLVAIQVDITDADAVLSHQDLVELIDFSQPVGVLILSVLQNTTQDEDVLAILRKVRDRLAPGSFMAISHISARTAPEIKDQISVSAKKHGYPPTVLRTDEQIESFFEGFDLVEPGVVDYRDWRPEDSTDRPEIGLQFVGALGKLR